LWPASGGLPGEARCELVMNREPSFKDVWVLIVCGLCVLAAMPRGPLTGFVAGAMGVDRGDHSALGYLRADVAQGACAAGALLVVCVFAATVWKRCPQRTTTGVFFAWFVLMPQIIFAFRILWRCLDLTDPKHADALLQDSELLPAAGWAGSYSGVAILLVLSCAQWLISRRRAAGDRVPVGSAQ
jgi:hypothetical protein